MNKCFRLIIFILKSNQKAESYGRLKMQNANKLIKRFLIDWNNRKMRSQSLILHTHTLTEPVISPQLDIFPTHILLQSRQDLSNVCIVFADAHLVEEIWWIEVGNMCREYV